MFAKNEIPVDAARRRKRRTALLLALIPALLASAFFADRFGFNGEEVHSSVQLPEQARQLARSFVKRGTTVSIGTPVPYKGVGGPEDTGPWIDEDQGGDNGGVLQEGQQPIGNFHSAGLKLYGSGEGLGDGGGFGGGGGGGTGTGDGTSLTCAQALEIIDMLKGSKKDLPCSELEHEAPGTGTVTLPPSELTGIVTTEGPAPDDKGGPAGTSTSSPITPVSAVPEPQSWLMMIGGFLMIGAAIRRRPAAARQQQPA